MNPEPTLYRAICPHCQGRIEVTSDQIKCKIFRHGVFKSNNHPINPHLPKSKCDELVSKNLIWGCGKPFWFDGTTIKKCEYI